MHIFIVERSRFAILFHFARKASFFETQGAILIGKTATRIRIGRVIMMLTRPQNTGPAQCVAFGFHELVAIRKRCRYSWPFEVAVSDETELARFRILN